MNRIQETVPIAILPVGSFGSARTARIEIWITFGYSLMGRLPQMHRQKQPTTKVVTPHCIALREPRV